MILASFSIKSFCRKLQIFSSSRTFKSFFLSSIISSSTSFLSILSFDFLSVLEEIHIGALGLEPRVFSIFSAPFWSVVLLIIVHTFPSISTLFFFSRLIVALPPRRESRAFTSINDLRKAAFLNKEPEGELPRTIRASCSFPSLPFLIAQERG